MPSSCNTKRLRPLLMSACLWALIGGDVANGANIPAADEIADAIYQADEAIATPDNREPALALAKAVQQLGVDRADPALQARGLIRMGFLNLHFGDWSDDAGKWQREAERLIADLPAAHIARAEVMMFEGYLNAMYFHKIEGGIAQLRKAITIARALPDDRLLAKAFYLLGRVLPYDAQDRQAFESLHRGARFARRAKMSRWEFASLKRAAAFNTHHDPDSPSTKRLAELSHELGVKAAFEDLPTEQRVKVARKLMAAIDSDVESHIPAPLQAVLDGLEAAKYMARYCMEREQWEEWERSIKIAKHAAHHLQSESDVQLVFIEWGAGLARQGRVEEALTTANRFLDKKKKIKHYGELSRVYAYLARQAGKGGDSDTAHEWFTVADEYKMKQDAQLRASLTQSAEDFYSAEMESRKLRSDLRGQEETLARSHARNNRILIGAGLSLICIWFWQRARQHRIAQGQLQDKVDEQTDSLRLAKESAEKANTAKTSFLARVNHELRNPLTALVSSCEILGQHLGDDPVATRCGNTITACSLSLVDVIDDILDFTQIESGELSLRESSFTLSNLMGTVQSIIQTKLADGVELQALMATNMPQQIRADEAKLRQVLINLAMNSARHTDAGHIRLECRVVAAKTADVRPRLVLAVADTGSGMSEADQASVFCQYKTHSERSNVGLGLYISRAFVECMGGTIECSSQPGAGTTFTLEIPFDAVEARTVLPIKPVKRSDGKRSFLVVDDEELNRETIQMLLDRLGHHAVAAESWAEASSILTSGSVDTVLLDLQMPEMSGYEVLNRIKALGLAEPPSVIALTGDATSGTRARTVAAGFSGFLAKPFRVANLLQLLESIPAINRAA